MKELYTSMLREQDCFLSSS